MNRRKPSLVQLPRERNLRGWPSLCWLGFFAILFACGAAATAQEPAKPQPEKQKLIRFQMRGEHWEQVLEWLSDATGLPVSSAGHKPQGTVTHISPKDKEYTIGEVLDFLNDGLLSQKKTQGVPGPFIIIRRPERLILIEADDPQSLDINLLPRITPEDLQAEETNTSKQKYGRTELVQVVFDLQTLSGDDAVRELTPLKGPFGKFTPVAKGNRILVVDSVGNLRRMKKHLDENDGPTRDKLEIIPLGGADGQMVITTLQKEWGIVPGGQRPAGAPSQLDLDTTYNRLFIRGNDAQRKRVHEVLEQIIPGLRKNSGAGSPMDAVRYVRLEGMTPALSSDAVITNLAHMWSKVRANPVITTTQSQLQQQVDQFGKKPATPPMVPPTTPPAAPNKPILYEGPVNPPQEIITAQLPGQPQQQQPQKPGPLVDPQSLGQGNEQKPGNPNKPIYLAPMTMGQGSGIMIASEDPEAVVLMEEMIRLMMQGGEGNYDVIQVRNTSAVEVAKTLDEYFNGKQQRGQGMNPMMAMMGMGRQPERPAAGPTIRIVADTRTNSILVKASKMTIAEIHRILDTYLDVADPSSETAPRQYIIGPLKNHSATKVADVLKVVFADYMRQDTRRQMMPQMPFNPFQPPPEPTQRGGPSIAIAVDDESNRILINCPEAYFKPIEDMVKELDRGAAGNKQEIEVIRPGGVDPAVLQQAMNIISGKGNNNNQNQNGNGNGQPQFPFGNNFNGFNGMNRGGGGQFNRGGGGQFNRGGGGGGNRGGGGGNRGMGGGRGGGGQRPEDTTLITDPSPGGPHFFVGRVKDDPRTAGLKTILYDPQQDPLPATFPQVTEVALYTQDQPPAGGQPVPPAGGQPAAGQQPDVNAPRRPLQIEVLPDGTVILIGDPADVANAKKIIDLLVAGSKVTETEIKLVGLKNGDANNITNILTQLYQRVNVTASSNSLSRQPQQPAFVPQGATQTQGAASIALIPVPRFNAILVAAPRGRMADIEKQIEQLDKKITNASLEVIQLRKQNASTVGTLIQQFFAARYPDQPPTTTLFLVVPDTSTNSIIIQASPADMEEVQKLIQHLETKPSLVQVEVQIVPLKNASATEIVTILQTAVAESLGISNLLGGGQQNLTGRPGQPTLPGQNQFGPGQQNLPGGQQRPGANLLQNLPSLGGATSPSRGAVLSLPGVAQQIESTVLQEVRAFADVRTNSIIVVAPKDSIDLIVKLIKQLDVQPSATAEVKVFTLKKADATLVQNVLLQIFMGQSAGTRQQGGPGGVNPGGLFGLNNVAGQSFGSAVLNTSAIVGEPPGLGEVRIAIDTRTNSLIIAASRGNMVLAEAIILRLDNAEIRERRTEIYRLKNSGAQDIATALTTALQQDVQILTTTQELTAFTQGERQVIIVPEPVTNSLVISASPQYFEKVMQLIRTLDAEPAQVVVSVLIAQVNLDNTDEFGVEWGLQSPIWFRRGVGVGTGGTTTGVAGVANPGYNFNTSAPLPNGIISPGVVAPQGITNFNVGRASPTAGIGGFVFSAGSDAVSVLIRALKVQGKLDVLSRPQITTLDNQVAFIQVGQTVPYITGSSLANNGQIINTIAQQPVGVILQVTPRINDDGNVVMRVEPQVSALSNSTVNLGNGNTAPIFNVTQASTTISAMNGQTVVIGGLITRSDDKRERKIPFLGELEYIGAAFRYRTYVKQKSELLIILTPHVIRNKSDAYRILAEETRKMDWAMGNVRAIHGPLGVEPDLPGSVYPHGGMNGNCGCSTPPNGSFLPQDQSFGPMMPQGDAVPFPQGYQQPNLPMPQQMPVPPGQGQPLQQQQQMPPPSKPPLPRNPNPMQPTGYYQDQQMPPMPPSVGPSIPGQPQEGYPTSLPSPYPPRTFRQNNMQPNVPQRGAPMVPMQQQYNNQNLSMEQQYDNPAMQAQQQYTNPSPMTPPQSNPLFQAPRSNQPMFQAPQPPSNTTPYQFMRGRN